MERYTEIIPDFESFKEALNKEPLEARINTLKSSTGEVGDMLEEEGIDFQRREFNKNFLKVDRGPGKTLAHWLGKIYSQEFSSGIPSMVLDPEPGEKVLDMCAAPGSKTTQMAAMMENEGKIIANDPQTGRLKGLMSNVYRTGSMNVQIFQRDGRNLPESWRFDKILVDAPCSGESSSPEGVPDLKRSEDIAELQKMLLEKGLKLCKEGGTLVYSTCTFAPEENELVVSDFLDRAELAEVDMDFEHSRGIIQWRGENLDKRMKRCARIYPHQIESGGIFVAKFKK